MEEQYPNQHDNNYDDEQSYSTDGGETASDGEYDDDDCIPSNSPKYNELKQHILAVGIAILAAIVTHAQIHGGYEQWKVMLVNDWNALRSSFGSRTVQGGIPRAAFTGGGAPHAAPVMNAIPTELGKKAVQKALLTESSHERSVIGHARASAYRRTADLDFCSHSIVDVATSKESGLVDFDFIIPLDPSVRVLHSYYLGDALRLDSSFVYDKVESFGGFDSDIILQEIDAAHEQSTKKDDEGLNAGQVRSILESHLHTSLVNDEHVCLLQQYTANKQSGRSIRGKTKAYMQPHVSSFYETNQVSASYALPTTRQQNNKMIPASLTFTGFATKFINLSAQSLYLYWDGGHISSGPKAGQIHTAFVGTIPSMESIGTASFPGHSFFVTPSYDKDHVLQRWTVTEDDAILYYDPFHDLSTEDQKIEIQKLLDTDKLSSKQKFAREAWILNRSFERDYLIKTGRHWFSVFPQPSIPILNGARAATNNSSNHMPMWSADYLGQIHTVETSELYFTSIPRTLPKLTKDDFLADAEQTRRLEMKNYQSSEVRGNVTTSNSYMQLDLKVVSCEPRVLEVKKFLSPVEAQHLIDLATGKKGDVSMQASTVMASGVNDKKVRSTRKQDTRSSTGGWIHREQDAIVDGIFRRVADLLHIDERMMRDQRPPHLIGTEYDASLPTHDRVVEAMQLLRYGPGEEYTAHHDFNYPSIDNRYQPKRYASVLLYLNGIGDIVHDGTRLTVEEGPDDTSSGLVGGETTFPRAITTEFHDGVKIKPRSGKAVLFYNVLPDGNMNDLSQHSGDKVETGVKYVANIWIWDPIIS